MIPTPNAFSSKLYSSSHSVFRFFPFSLQEMEMRNSELERRIQNAEQNLNSSLEERDRVDAEIQRIIEILDIKIFDLNDLRQSLVKLIDK